MRFVAVNTHTHTHTNKHTHTHTHTDEKHIDATEIISCVTLQEQHSLLTGPYFCNDCPWKIFLFVIWTRKIWLNLKKRILSWTNITKLFTAQSEVSALPEVCMYKYLHTVMVNNPAQFVTWTSLQWRKITYLRCSNPLSHRDFQSIVMLRVLL